MTSQNGPLNDVDVVVLDEMGQLLTWYGVAQAAFIGGTLIDHGATILWRPPPLNAQW